MTYCCHLDCEANAVNVEGSDERCKTTCTVAKGKHDGHSSEGTVRLGGRAVGVGMS